jgi:hypothetical protein
VPYHDSNDFYYSGHIGTCFIVVLEARAKKWYRLSWFCFFVMINQWFMMMLVRAHYIIDLTTGLMVAHYMHKLAERLSYIIDIKCFRQHLPAPPTGTAEKVGDESVIVKEQHVTKIGSIKLEKSSSREHFHFHYCKSCGWSNDRPMFFSHSEEHVMIKTVAPQPKKSIDTPLSSSEK